MSASRQHVLQSQSSVNSTASIQTVLHQTDATLQTSSISQLQTSIIINGSGQSQLHLQQHQNQNNNQQSTHQQQQHHHPSDSISSFLEQINPPAVVMSASVNGGGESPLNIGDVADLLNPQHAIITG